MKKDLWCPDEDEKLKKYVAEHGYGNWTDAPKKAGLQRGGKSCRLRWVNYLRPGLKRGQFSEKEAKLIVCLQQALGRRWSKIAAYLPGRTDNDIKNFWHSLAKNKHPRRKNNHSLNESAREGSSRSMGVDPRQVSCGSSFVAAADETSRQCGEEDAEFDELVPNSSSSSSSSEHREMQENNSHPPDGDLALVVWPYV